ncbi:hypothetical protein DVB69_08910 [Sporosarcina sp. BI001-red]|uniref:hypothetical protein n=1 Tax=Sporosarcina sp. BI001-red TaxID=2282866 RepID=UPI000E23369A|nr:hypothetical protein [Sporosarcina sp. BI001-red]REB08081.1 hypothetical protein DVB69_08910 [Sporosarcina sp. BI001-red]
MKNKEKKIRPALDKTVFHKDSFTQQDKQTVRRKIQRTQRPSRFVPAIVGTLFAVSLVFIGIFLMNTKLMDSAKQNGLSNEDMNNTGAFTIANLSAGPFLTNETYYIVLPITWNGNSTATIKEVELFKENQQTLQTSDGISYTFYGGDAAKRPGVYARDQIGEISDIHGVEIEKESSLILEVSLRIVVPDKSRTIKIRYSVDGEDKEQNLTTGVVQGLETLPEDTSSELGSIELNTAEQNVYTAFEKDLDTQHLVGLSPMSVAKLYIQASYLEDHEVVYALYTDRKEYTQWSEKEDRAIPDSDRGTREQLTQQFRNFEQGRFLQTSKIEGYIEYYPNSNNEPPSGFQLIKNKDGIWQVAFMPIQ